MRRRAGMVLGLLSCLTWGAWAGCSDDDGGTNNAADAGVDAGPDAEVPVIPIAVDCTDATADVYGDPGTLPTTPGDIIRCAPDGHMSQQEVQDELDAVDYQGDPMTSGAWVYRVLYLTTRAGDLPGYSSALVLVPDTPRADPLPAIVASHGSRGQAASCAPSLDSPAGAYVQDDFERQVLPLVGAGYVVIAPDLAGYANFGASGNPPSGYALSDDVARSTLDGVAALRNLVGAHLSDQVVLTGHSQGGHTALSAMALANSYGMEGTLAAVVLYAPLWFSQSAWAAMFLLPSSFTISGTPSAVATGIWYHYTHSELLDGPGHGLDLFAPDKQQAVQDFIDNACWSAEYPGLAAVGDQVDSFYDPAYVSAIKMPAAMGTDCGGDTLCETWMDRFAADRPHLTGDATTVPILLAYGMEDTTITPDLMSCVLQRLHSDGVNLEVCINNTADHNKLPAHEADYVNHWLATRLLGEPAQGTCDGDLSTFMTEDGTPVIQCAPVPPND